MLARWWHISKPTITALAQDSLQEWKQPGAQMIVCEDISDGAIAWNKTDPHIQLKLGQSLLGPWYDKLLSESSPWLHPSSIYVSVRTFMKT